LVFSLSLSGCHAAAPATSIDDTDGAGRVKREVLAAFERACDLDANARLPPPVAPTLEAPPTPPPGARPGPVLPGVFLEMALFTAPTGVAQAKDVRSALAAAPTARLVAAPHVSLDFDRTVLASFEEHTGPLAHTALRAIGGTAHLASDGQIALELDMHLQLPTGPNAPPTVDPPETRVRFVLGPSERKPIAATAAVPTRAGESAVVLLVAYVIRDQADLRAIFECKMRERERQRQLALDRNGGRNEGPPSVRPEH
jgi:hypothetical protein